MNEKLYFIDNPCIELGLDTTVYIYYPCIELGLDTTVYIYYPCIELGLVQLYLYIIPV